MSMTEAILRLRPGSEWTLIGDTYDGLVWLSKDTEKPTLEEIEEESKKIAAEIEATKYVSLRKAEYPPLEEFADALYWNSKGDSSKLEEYLSKVDQVKQRYPKP